MIASPHTAGLQPAESTPPQLLSTASTSRVGEPPTDGESLASAVDRARAAVNSLSPEAKATALSHADAILAFHAEALRIIVRKLKSDLRGRELLLELVENPLLYAAMLSLGVVKPDLTTRVARAIEHVRAYARSHGGDVELVRIEGDTAMVRMSGACSGCSMSSQTLSEGVETAIRAAVPEIHRVEQVHDRAVPGFIPLTPLTVTAAGARGQHPDPQHGWIRGPEALSINDRRPTRFLNDGCDLLLVRRGHSVFAYRNTCPHQGMPLDDAAIAPDGTLTCPFHGLRFDVCSGECHDQPAVQLDPVPLMIHDGHVWVRPVETHA